MGTGTGIHDSDRNVGGRLAPEGLHDDWQSSAQVDAAAADLDLEGAGGGSGAGAAAGAPTGRGPGGGNSYYILLYPIYPIYPEVPDFRIPPSDNPLIFSDVIGLVTVL